MKKLPVVGTSAAQTAFCAVQVHGPQGTSLWLDGNGKITRDMGDLEHPVPNAFSLLSQGVEDKAGRGGVHCPGATPTCKASCYVDGLAKHASDTYALYEHNSAEIRKILANDQLACDWAMLLAKWLTDNVSSFRWHVSGDVFSLEYAQWIADVCAQSPTVKHWIYTRSFEFLRPLAAVSTACGGNLALNLSADKDNGAAAASASISRAGVVLRICYLTSDGVVPEELVDGDVIFPDYALRGGTERGREWFEELPAHQKKMVCPVDFHGKSEQRRCGPCDRCLT